MQQVVLCTTRGLYNTWSLQHVISTTRGLYNTWFVPSRERVNFGIREGPCSRWGRWAWWCPVCAWLKILLPCLKFQKRRDLYILDFEIVMWPSVVILTFKSNLTLQWSFDPHSSFYPHCSSDLQKSSDNQYSPVISETVVKTWERWAAARSMQYLNS